MVGLFFTANIEIPFYYNPQNEMFWHFRTKCSFSKTKRTSLTLFSINHIQ